MSSCAFNRHLLSAECGAPAVAMLAETTPQGHKLPARPLCRDHLSLFVDLEFLLDDLTAGRSWLIGPVLPEGDVTP